MLNFELELYNGKGILKLKGDITAYGTEELNEAFLIAIDNSEHLLIDFDGVTVMDKSVLQQIRTAENISVKLNKRMTLVNLQPDLLKRIDTCNSVMAA